MATRILSAVAALAIFMLLLSTFRIIMLQNEKIDALVETTKKMEQSWDEDRRKWAEQMVRYETIDAGVKKTAREITKIRQSNEKINQILSTHVPVDALRLLSSYRDSGRTKDK